MKQITMSDMQQQSAAAVQSPRLRAHRNFHPELSDSVQRLAIAMEPGTYVRPHRHPHTFELLLPLRGRFVVLNFDDRGTVTHRAILGETCTVLEMAAGTWHAVLSLDTGGIIFEVKHGGYQPVAADDYAHWAPAEGEPGTTELMAWYAQAQVGDSAFAV
ncbi:TPA: WbuC family cupin fold metalloprotein [Escherichia coli]|nr:MULTISPECIES: WbuC family cupin fold metalloprotein [Enterobacteriaceae]HBM9794693.1 WbuC family cupin fold metalloprotein [Escherichia albertii]MBE0239314.1 cupin fold metalloprotein, WbuC family [Klebsiella pneumoniae]MCT9837371.1 WbuC family cupin fold metalloprotein [Escherichia coli]SYH37512.1 Tryptophan synthase subunit beta like protein [Klebsiella pneumoniae]HBA5837577.1 WbuC family cupin fold metalloprotein [Escherichia coli]